MKIINNLQVLYTKYQSNGYKLDNTRNKELTRKAEKLQNEAFAPDELEFYVKKYEGKGRVKLIFKAIAEVAATFGLGLFTKKIKADVEAAFRGERIIAASKKAQIQKNKVLAPLRGQVKTSEEKLAECKTLAEHLAIKEIVQSRPIEFEESKESKSEKLLNSLPKHKREMIEEILANLKINYDVISHTDQLGCHVDDNLVIERLDEPGGDVIDVTLKTDNVEGSLLLDDGTAISMPIEMTVTEYKDLVKEFLEKNLNIPPEKIKDTENGFRIKL